MIVVDDVSVKLMMIGGKIIIFVVPEKLSSMKCIR
jgi:hypothetical protein